MQNLGSRNYTRRPVAVIAGGGYDDAMFEEMRKASAGKSTVPWLRPDASTPTPPLGPAYGVHMVQRVKTCLRKLEEEGRMGVDGVWLY